MPTDEHHANRSGQRPADGIAQRAPLTLGISGRMSIPGYDPARDASAQIAVVPQALYAQVRDLLAWLLGLGAPSGPRLPRRYQSLEAARRLQVPRPHLHLLSPLAPGADTIAAEAALDYAAESGASILVRAFLPLPADQYAEASTFHPLARPAHAPALRARFEQTLRRVRDQASPGKPEPVEVVQLLADPRAEISAPSVERSCDAIDPSVRYRAAGEGVASLSDLLLVMVETEMSSPPVVSDPDLFAPGTDAIVAWHLAGLPPRCAALPADRDSRTRRAPSPVLLFPFRSTSQLDGVSPPEPRWLYPRDWA